MLSLFLPQTPYCWKNRMYFNIWVEKTIKTEGWWGSTCYAGVHRSVAAAASKSHQCINNHSDDIWWSKLHLRTGKWNAHGWYIGAWGLGEHLRSIRKNSPGFPVAEHFNSASHSLNDIMICGLKRCSGDNTRRKKQEMRLIFELGTLKPNGLNINFSFI